VANINTIEMFKNGEVIVVNNTTKDVLAWVKQGYSIENLKQAASKPVAKSSIAKPTEKSKKLKQ